MERASKALSELAEKLGIRKDKPKDVPNHLDVQLSTLSDKERAVRKKRRKQAKLTRRRNRRR